MVPGVSSSRIGAIFYLKGRDYMNRYSLCSDPARRKWMRGLFQIRFCLNCTIHSGKREFICADFSKIFHRNYEPPMSRNKKAGVWSIQVFICLYFAKLMKMGMEVDGCLWYTGRSLKRRIFTTDTSGQNGLGGILWIRILKSWIWLVHPRSTPQLSSISSLRSESSSDTVPVMCIQTMSSIDSAMSAVISRR